MSSGTEILLEGSRVWTLVANGTTQDSGDTFDGHLGVANFKSGSSIGDHLAPGRDLTNASFSVDMASLDSTTLLSK